MATTLVFVHGIGTFSPGWSKEIVQALDAAVAAQNYAAFQGKPASKQVTLVELLYDPYFAATLQAWSTLASDAAGQGFLNLGWLQALKGSSSFVATHVLDVMQWYFLAQVQHQIVDHLASELLKIQDLENTHIVAHSLGTAVMQRTLQAIASGGYGAAPGKLGSLHMVANVSRILEDGQTPVYGGASPSLVRPLAYAGDEAYFLMKYCNYHNVADPITLVDAFHDPGPGWPSSFYLDVPVTYLAKEDLTKVHDFTNYVSAPQVHIPLLRCVFGYQCVTPAEEAAALAATATANSLQPGASVSSDIGVFLRTIADNAHLLAR